MKCVTMDILPYVLGGRRMGRWMPEDSREIEFVTTDSRKAGHGCLFAAILGNRVDGHDYIQEVMEGGAFVCVSEKDLGDVQFPYILVKSTKDALKSLAAYYLKALGITVVGISGSVGKTSTKEMIACVLSQKYRVLKTEGNFNNELGVPLTIFRLTTEDEIAVLELGINHFGEMQRLAKITKPDIMVITNIGSCHLEYLGDLDGVFRAKTECFPYVKDCAVLNSDDERLRTVKEVAGKSPVFFGVNDGRGDYTVKDVSDGGLNGTSCKICTPKGDFDVHIGIPGEHMLYNALAATAVGERLFLSHEEISAGISQCIALQGRNNIVSTSKYTIIDDCYNANPMSMRASLSVLEKSDSRRVAILGDMGELGEGGVKAHTETGQYAAEGRADVIIAVGDLSKYICEGATDVNKDMPIYHYPDVEKMLEGVFSILKDGDTILVKASHSMEFEKIVKFLRDDKAN